MIEKYYSENSKGKILWSCGLGKSLMGIMIAEKLNCKKILIGVPSCYLQSQMYNEVIKIFNNHSNILFIGGDCNMSTTNKNIIFSFLCSNKDYHIIITTYHSCYILLDDEFVFDIKIGDEAHHLVGINNDSDRCFELFHKIKSDRTLFMTATEKIIDSLVTTKYSMDDETIFGKCIDILSVKWAIEQHKITDYYVLLIKNTYDEINTIINTINVNIDNKELFISSYITLKAFEKYNNLDHILLYTNSTYDADLANIYINKILDTHLLNINKNQIYNKSLYSKNCNDIDAEVRLFKNSKYGIISCVYLFGEGFDLPSLNGVCISSSMYSEIRIVQYMLRPNRLDKTKPYKMAYIILPYIDNDDNSYNKVKNIISQLRNVDDKIEQKIRLDILADSNNNEKSDKCNMNHNNLDNIEELNKILLKLKYSKALNSEFSDDQDEYNYMKAINKQLNISSKEEYFDAKPIYEHHIENPETYFRLCGVWINWYDFLNINTINFIKTKEEWITFCLSKNINSLDKYNDLCKKYECLPFKPDEFYIHFTNISNELHFHTKRR
jgi:predicted helicase